jgi:hypothetical protein
MVLFSGQRIEHLQLRIMQNHRRIWLLPGRHVSAGHVEGERLLTNIVNGRQDFEASNEWLMVE